MKNDEPRSCATCGEQRERRYNIVICDLTGEEIGSVAWGVRADACKNYNHR